MSNKCVANHVLLRNETYYFLKRVPTDLKDYYSVKRLCFSLKTKSYASALSISNSSSLELYLVKPPCILVRL